ncbi:MAG: hypothetical protein WBB19_02010 [Desulforhopalus sp.]
MVNKKQQRVIIGSIMAATGKTVEMVARERGYTKVAFYDVIKGKTKTPFLKNLIASITGKPITELWPNEKEHHNA